MRLAEIAARLGGELIGDPQTEIEQVATLRSAGARHISFFSQTKYRPELEATAAGAVIVGDAERDATARPRIVCKDPYLYFAQVSVLLNPPSPVVPGIHAAAVIAQEARIHASAHVGAGAVIAAGALVEEGAYIGPGCVIGAAARVGAHSRLHARVTLYDRCEIGKRVIIHAGVVLGADGFGFAPQEGRWLKIPQIGRVIVGDDVEIGANTTIDRGALDDTVIEEGVKLDNQIQIGHNVRIGAHTAVAGCAGIAGSTTIGKHCMIGGAAMISGHITIGDGVVVAGGSTVTHSIETPGMYASTIPAVPAKEWRKTVALLRGLEDMQRRIRELKKDGGKEK